MARLNSEADSSPVQALSASATAGGIVILAGAGVSVDPPSSLPSWYPLNAAILRVLCDRFEAFAKREGWTAQIPPLVEHHRERSRLPPDYQAQLIEEMCGERYFRALQALDVDAINVCHDGIARMGAAGALRAVVTTNFDRLIERALERLGVPFSVAFDERGFLEMGRRLATGACEGPLPIIKIHGCVRDHRSMIDTSKQRKRGRSAALQACLDPVLSLHWLYLGFSGDDLAADPGYLGLIEGARRGSRGTYVRHPRGDGGKPKLSTGAQCLMDAYGDRGQVIVDSVPSVLSALLEPGGKEHSATLPSSGQSGAVQVDRALRQWAAELSAPATAVCIGGILEAVGESRAAFQVLSRFRKDVHPADRQGPDYESFQLHYGRIGAAYGQMIAVPDLFGSTSNASVETVQDLLRLRLTDNWFAAHGWAGCALLWSGAGDGAAQHAARFFEGINDECWSWGNPRSPEEIVDGWLSAAQYVLVDGTLSSVLYNTYPKIASLALQSGDVVRQARANSLWLLALANTNTDFMTTNDEQRHIYEDITRIGDGFADGFRALAIGRWNTAWGGLQRMAAMLPNDRASVPEAALRSLAIAWDLFQQQGLDPWLVYVRIQTAKAYFDVRRLDEAQESLDQASAACERFPVWWSHVHEATGMMLRALGKQEQARQAFAAAIETAEEGGLISRVRMLRGDDAG